MRLSLRLIPLLALVISLCSVAQERVVAPKESDLFAYNVFAASDPDMARIREFLRQTCREIRAIVAASHPSQSTALVQTNLMRWT